MPNVQIRIRAGVYSWHDVGAILIPTYSWYLLRRRDLALRLTAAYAACLVAAVLCLGWPPAGWAIGVMMTLHGVGIAEYFYSGILSPRPENRVIRYAAVIFSVGVVYTYLSPRVLSPIVVPMQFGGRVLLVNPRKPSKSAKHEDVVSFEHASWRHGHFMIPDGTNLGRIVGLGGDVVAFQGGVPIVNGVPQSRLRGMPGRGEVRVPAGHLMVWPFDLRRDFGNDNEALDFTQKVTVIPEARVQGRPYEWWFLRRQVPVTLPK